MRQMVALLLLAVIVCWPQSQSLSQQKSDNSLNKAVSLIEKQRYPDAISQIEQILEKTPQNADAVTYLAAAYLYSEKDYVKAQKRFEEASKAGGGASFLVSHSHEMAKMSTDELTDYCRGWLYLRKDGVVFAPEDGAHGFKMAFAEIAEFKQNRLSPRLFHIKQGKENYNFRPHTRTQDEALLIIIMYKKFAG